MIPSPADLSYFAEVARTLNISRAAERLGISQPSLSLAIRRLEDSAGVPLFTRSRRGVSLTRAGLQMLAHSKLLLQSWDQIRARALASVNEVQGTYTIGCHASVALSALSGFLPGLIAGHPRLEIKLVHDLSRKITEEVISARIDMGIVVNPVRHPDLVIHHLCGDDFTLWRSAAGKCAERVLICDPELAQAQSLMTRLRKKGLKFERVITSGNLEVIADLAANGCGLGLLPAQVAARAAKKLVPVAKSTLVHDEHCLIFRIENKGVRSIQTLSRAIRDSFAKKQVSLS